MKRFYTQCFICILGFCMILVLFSACGSSSHGTKKAASPETGSISFNLNWISSPAPLLRALSPSGNPCTDYGIEEIQAKVYKDPNTVIASAICSCDDGQNIINDIPEGSGYTLTIEGLASGESEWRGEIPDITVIPGETKDLGSVSMSYVGSDSILPDVQLITPSSLAMDVPIDINIIVMFNKDIVEASLNPDTFVLECDGNMISGMIAYNNESKIATFEPDSPLSYATTYTVTMKKEIQDKNAHKLPADISWSFTTEMDSLIWDEGKWDESQWVN